MLERAAGIEPASLAWKAKVLPLHNARAACLLAPQNGRLNPQPHFEWPQSLQVMQPSFICNA